MSATAPSSARSLDAIEQYTEDCARVLDLFRGPIRHTEIGAYEAGKITKLGVARAKQVLDGLVQVGELVRVRTVYRLRCKRADQAIRMRRRKIAGRKAHRRHTALEALKTGQRLDLTSLGELLGVKSATARDVLWSLEREGAIVMRRVGRAKVYVLATEPPWPKEKRKRIRPKKPPSRTALRRQHILDLLARCPMSPVELGHLFSSDITRGRNAAANTLRAMFDRGLLTREYGAPKSGPGAPRLIYRTAMTGETL